MFLCSILPNFTNKKKCSFLKEEQTNVLHKHCLIIASGAGTILMLLLLLD